MNSSLKYNSVQCFGKFENFFLLRAVESQFDTWMEITIAKFLLPRSQLIDYLRGDIVSWAFGSFMLIRTNVIILHVILDVHYDIITSEKIR